LSDPRRRVDYRAELGYGAVAHQFDDAPVIFGDDRADHLAAHILDRFERAGLFLLDEARVGRC
jgi:hypothetical protein